MSTCRRSQISDVFQAVLTNAPGGSPPPKPARDSFQVESLNPGLDQSPVGLSVVKRQRPGAASPAATTGVTFGGLGIGAHPEALIESRRAHFCQTSLSYSIWRKTPPTTGRAV